MTLKKTKPTYQDLTKLMFTDGNPKTDKNKHIKDLDQYLIKRLNLAPAKYPVLNLVQVGPRVVLTLV